MKLECKTCGYGWDYKGQGFYATCPKCLRKVKAKGVNKKSELKNLKKKFEAVFEKETVKRIFNAEMTALELRHFGISVPTLNELKGFELVAKGKGKEDNSFEELIKRGFSPEEISRMAEMGAKIDEGDMRPGWLKDKDKGEY